MSESLDPAPAIRADGEIVTLWIARSVGGRWTILMRRSAELAPRPALLGIDRQPWLWVDPALAGDALHMLRRLLEEFGLRVHEAESSPPGWETANRPGGPPRTPESP